MSKKKNFTWDKWAVDGEDEEEAYVIAKDHCPDKDKIKDLLLDEDGINIAEDYHSYAISEGFCKFQVRSDWVGCEGERYGWYVVEEQKNPPKDMYGKKKAGWFPVWIVRLAE